jgi:hypothetical protein
LRRQGRAANRHRSYRRPDAIPTAGPAAPAARGNAACRSPGSLPPLPRTTMPRLRAVRFDRVTLDAVLSLDADAVRLPVPEDECERLGLVAGLLLAMGIDDGGMRPVRVTEVRRGEPFSIVAVEFPAWG